MMKKGPSDIIDQLSPDDALAILKIATRKDKETAAQITEIARAYLREVDPGEIAFILHDELTLLQVEEVWDRAGPQRYGYVEPNDAAYEMIENVLNPYLEDLKKYQRLDMNTEATKICMGLFWGLYRFEIESDTEFKDWVPDAIGLFADIVLDIWKSGNPSRADINMLETFNNEQLAGWAPRIYNL